MRILGIDLGLSVCGYVICDIKRDIEMVKENEVRPKRSFSFNQKLFYIFENFRKEIEEYKPQVLVVEKLYSHYRHPLTLGVLAQVRGVIALLSEINKLNFFEFSSTRARKSFIGKGNVDSFRVKKIAENILGRQFRSVHTADAFSLVVAFSHSQKLNTLI
ncbi:MAG: crossover junction endodeoxyribonuclease RuvC [Candidatus Aenigmatarchaeota archaeon]